MASCWSVGDVANAISLAVKAIDYVQDILDASEDARRLFDEVQQLASTLEALGAECEKAKSLEYIGFVPNKRIRSDSRIIVCFLSQPRILRLGKH
jgi:hypothetical protein